MGQFQSAPALKWRNSWILPNLTGVSTTGFESLGPFLELLAWLGGPFRCEMIADSIGLEDDACRRQLEAAVQLGLVDRHGDDYQLSSLGYSFLNEGEEAMRAASDASAGGSR